MRGKSSYKQVEVLPDPIYQAEVVAKFINYVMRDGKKAKAQKIVYNSFKIIEKNTKKKPLDVFNDALKNVGPYVEVRSKRVGGANYQVPVEVSKRRRLALAMRWLLDIARSTKGKSMAECIANELILASQEKGDAVKKREDIHKMAEANKAFAHFSSR
ncbi:MAG: 30S ribosomal protein S7 [Patescibacteria group bacterium]|nr:30S ribosomal protein S7 [Patescibacteria group bacterium]